MLTRNALAAAEPVHAMLDARTGRFTSVAPSQAKPAPNQPS